MYKLEQQFLIFIMTTDGRAWAIPFNLLFLYHEGAIARARRYYCPSQISRSRDKYRVSKTSFMTKSSTTLFLFFILEICSHLIQFNSIQFNSSYSRSVVYSIKYLRQAIRKKNRLLTTSSNSK
jgi:hypothetical protein